MTEMEQSLKERQEEEKMLRFSRFTNTMALEIGLSLIEKVKREEKAVAIDITRNGQQLFHYAFEGTSPDNDQWIIRKNRVVNRFLKSSLHVYYLLESQGKTIEERYGLDWSEYADRGGAFPIIVNDVGVVGTITVSGLPHEEDHRLVVEGLKDYLGK